MLASRLFFRARIFAIKDAIRPVCIEKETKPFCFQCPEDNQSSQIAALTSTLHADGES